MARIRGTIMFEQFSVAATRGAYGTAKLCAVAAALAVAGPTTAATQTINRAGHVVFHVPLDPVFNPGGATSIPGVALGDTITFSATYDDADLFDASGSTTFLGEVVTASNFKGVELGNGNPVNAASVTVGSQHFDLSDQVCFQDSVCSAAAGQEFPLGPTLLFKDGKFLGMDSCLVQGSGIGLCSLVLDNLAPTLQGFNRALLGYTRTDLFLVNDPNFNTVFIGQFDGPGIAGIPEPASWALMIAGFACVGVTSRRRAAVRFVTE